MHNIQQIAIDKKTMYRTLSMYARHSVQYYHAVEQWYGNMTVVKLLV